MRRLSPALGLAALAGAVLWAPATAAGGPATTVLRLDGIGPLHLGMTRTAALEPKAIMGSAEFADGRLTTLSFTRGVRTSTGVTVGRTTTARMVARYRAAGFTASARFVSTFQGTFVRVRRHGRDVVGGFGEGSVVTIVAIPAVPVCE